MLMCSERSGSNLITRMMGAHPDICSPAPSHLIRLLAENRSRYGDLAVDQNWKRMLSDAAEILQTQLGHWQQKWSAADLHQAVPDRSLIALVRHLFQAEADAAGTSRLFIKENHIYRYLPFLQRAFPDMQIVWLVRDPRDMALSWKNSSILRGDAVRAARIWLEDQSRGLQVMGYLADQTVVHQLRYEDLVSDPATELGRICDALGLEPAPEMVDFHRNGDAVRASGRTSDWQNLDRPVMSTNFGKYRTGLSATEIALVEVVCGEVMEAFGYQREAENTRPLVDLEHELLPLERHEKPGWANVPTAEKELRQARTELLKRIASYPWQPTVQLGVQHA